MRWTEIVAEVPSSRDCIQPSDPTCDEEPGFTLVPIPHYPAIWARLIHIQSELAWLVGHLRALGLDADEWARDAGE